MQLTIPPASRGRRLDQTLAALLPTLSRSQVQRVIRDGRVRVNGAITVRPSEPVTGGEHITLDPPELAPTTPAPQALPLTILYEDSAIGVIDKPAGMVVHPAAGHPDGTLVNALLYHVEDLSGFAGERRPGIVHRLDKGTSGLMVVAKHDRAHRELTRQFSQREVEKGYVALVWGLLQEGQRIEAAIGRDPHHRQRMSVRARRARDAVTVVTRAEPLRGVTLAHVAIATGRTHQIRVHLQAIGHPLVGDALYGGVRRRLPPDLHAVARLDRPFLHAGRLVFSHPLSRQQMAFESPLPEDLRRVLEPLRGATGPKR